MAIPKKPLLPPTVDIGHHSGSSGYLMNEFVMSKLNILEQLDEAMAQEENVLDMLNTHFKNRDFGTADKKDVVKEKQKIHTAIQHEVQAETDVHKSLNSLEEALEALDSDVQPHIQPNDPVLNSAIQADINGP